MLGQRSLCLPTPSPALYPKMCLDCCEEEGENQKGWWSTEETVTLPSSCVPWVGEADIPHGSRRGQVGEQTADIASWPVIWAPRWLHGVYRAMGLGLIPESSISLYLREKDRDRDREGRREMELDSRGLGCR